MIDIQSYIQGVPKVRSSTHDKPVFQYDWAW